MKLLDNHKIVYVTRDLERGLGLTKNTPNYFIIANFTPFAKKVAEERNDIKLINGQQILDTWQLLEHPEVAEFINQNHASILVFKNTKQIQRICTKNDWDILNPQAELSSRIEEKISQLTFLPELKNLFPSYEVKTCGELTFNEPFVLQFNHAHTGEGTIYIESQEQLDKIKEKFSKREVRTSGFISGPIFTNNNVTHSAGVIVGNISYQITGLKPYTKNPFATVGNDWTKANQILSKENVEQYNSMAKKIGNTLKQKGWKGMFGIDVILEEKTNKIHLIEINARQPQSAVFESYLQNKTRTTNEDDKITIFEAHVLALLDLDISKKEIIKINTGSQIIDRRGLEVNWIKNEK